MNSWRGYISLSLVMLLFALAILFSEGLLPIVKIIGVSVFIILTGIALRAAYLLNSKTEIDQFFKIKKGSHRSTPLKFWLSTDRAFTIVWKFTDQPKQTESYTSKIAGFGYFPHHLYNSWRIGYEIIDGQITYSMYTREKGKFKITKLPGLTDYKGKIGITLKSNFIIVTYGKGWKLHSRIVLYTPTSKVGYFLKPHHGGKEASLIDYSIKVKVI